MKNEYEPIFDLESQIMDCWQMTSDLDLITMYFLEDSRFRDKIDPDTWDEIANKYLGLKEVYEVKFEKLWETFGKTTEEYHRRGKSE